MRRRIGKVLVILVLAMSIFLCVCCTASEDALSSDTDVKEEAVEETTVSEDETLILPSEDQMETETEEISEKTDDGEITETVEEVDEPVENSEDKNLIFYVCDEKVWENELFCAFLEGKTTAYDKNQEGELTWSEYFKQEVEYRHGLLQGIQLAAEDLDGDGKVELMIMFDDHGESTNLYVFHEKDGKLYAWDKIVNFFVVRGNDVVLREGGIFEDIGATSAYGIAHYTWRFNGDGETEDIWGFSEEVKDFTGEDGTEYIRSNQSLFLYEDGECVRELSYVLQMPEWQQDWSKAELVEGDENFKEIYSALLDDLPEEIARFSLAKWAENVAEIPIWEVPGGQGWVSVEDPPENRREFEYVGEEGNAEGDKTIQH